MQTQKNFNFFHFSHTQSAAYALIGFNRRKRLKLFSTFYLLLLSCSQLLILPNTQYNLIQECFIDLLIIIQQEKAFSEGK